LAVCRSFSTTHTHTSAYLIQRTSSSTEFIVTHDVPAHPTRAYEHESECSSAGHTLNASVGCHDAHAAKRHIHFMPQDQNLAEGCWVLLHDIVSRPEINGCRAIVIGEFDSEKRRWPVRVIKCKGRSEDMLLRPTNLVLLADSDSDQSDSIDRSGSKNDEEEEVQQPGSKFQCDYKISQNMDQPYRSFSGAPLMSFYGSSVLFSTEAMQKHQFCNSTACPLGAGLSSEQLVQAFKRIKLRACEKCRNSWYCSKDCQVHDWVQGDHRAQCAEIGLCRSKMLNPARSDMLKSPNCLVFFFFE